MNELSLRAAEALRGGEAIYVQSYGAMFSGKHNGDCFAALAMTAGGSKERRLRSDEITLSLRAAEALRGGEAIYGWQGAIASLRSQ